MLNGVDVKQLSLSDVRGVNWVGAARSCDFFWHSA